jgi:hypothetical protein
VGSVKIGNRDVHRRRAGIGYCRNLGNRGGVVFSELPPTEAASGQRLTRRRAASRIFRPVDDVEKHSALEHFQFQIGGMRFPFGVSPTRNRL